MKKQIRGPEIASGDQLRDSLRRCLINEVLQEEDSATSVSRMTGDL